MMERIATRCTESTGWREACEETSLQTRLGFSNPFPDALAGKQFLSSRFILHLRAFAPLRQNLIGSGLDQADLREIGSEVAAVKCRQGICLNDCMSSNKKVGQDRGAGATFAPVIPEDLAGQQGGVLIKIAHPEIKRLDRFHAGGVGWEKGTDLAEHDGGDDEAFALGQGLEQIQPCLSFCLPLEDGEQRGGIDGDDGHR